MYRYRRLNLEEDYIFLKEIWENSPMKIAPVPEMLSYSGVVVTDSHLNPEEAEILGAVFLYTPSDSFVCFVGFPILSEKVKIRRDEVLRTMYEKLEWIAKYNGKKLAVTYSTLEVIDKHMLDFDYSVGDKEITQFMKVL